MASEKRKSLWLNEDSLCRTAGSPQDTICSTGKRREEREDAEGMQGCTNQGREEEERIGRKI